MIENGENNVKKVWMEDDFFCWFGYMGEVYLEMCDFWVMFL